MKLLFPIGIADLGLTVAANAQDTTVKSQTRIKADDAKVMSMTGCLRQDPLSRAYTLTGGPIAIGDDVKTKTQVKTDVDKDSTTVKGKSKTTVDDGAVATSGTTGLYVLVPANNVDLSANVGHQVRVDTIMVEGGHGDADVTIKEKAKVDPDHAPDSKTESKTKIELPKGALGSYSVVSLTSLAETCTP